ncbi:MAG: hypothetical protein F6K00_22760 [Leptolyngbya sp. SIOISBB]|nr:hypothetical protein [Leptolyngbya sp. SIOISBB]
MARWHFLLGLGLLTSLSACGLTTDTDSSAPESLPAESVAADDTALETDEPPSASPETMSQLTDTVVVPGDRVGPITSDTSRADLVDMFGEAVLADTEVAVGEGFTESGTVVADGSEQTFAVIWVDDRQAEPATVKDFGPVWQTPEGVGIGTSFAELQGILGPFELYGFGWDYGGTLVLENSNLSDYYGSLILRVQPSNPELFQQEAGAFQALQGDKLISSEDPNLPDLDLVVDEMIVYINPPSE